MKSIATWVQASRLHTLPLSLSGIIIGSSLAYSNGFFKPLVFVLSIVTATALQILSNFANDYGDFKKGTDAYRIGPKRSVQSGAISAKQMKLAVYWVAGISLVMIFVLVYLAFENQGLYMLVFVALGAAAILAAVGYTMGKSPYGYVGLGDVFVFIFFGWISVCGSYFLYVHSIHWKVFFPATAIGLLSVAVLNLNNMRDYESDKANNKKTMVVRMGISLSKPYHYILLLGAMISLMLFSLLSFHSLKRLLYMPVFIPLILHIMVVAKNKNPRQLNPELKYVALCTFFLALLFATGQWL